jgi:hypothetical protein
MKSDQSLPASAIVSEKHLSPADQAKLAKATSPKQVLDVLKNAESRPVGASEAMELTVAQMLARSVEKFRGRKSTKKKKI